MTSPSNPIQGIPPPKSKWRPIVITIVSAFLLSVGSCFGAIVGGGKTASVILAFVFVSSVIALVAGLIWALVTLIQK
jgi:hypothetical protein